MLHRSRLIVMLSIAFISVFLFASFAQAATRPKVRAITAFVKIDRANYKSQFADAAKMLRAAKAEYLKAGYEVQTVRITTQPFPQYVKGMTDADAITFL